MTSFSACALQFLLYFDLAFNYVSAIYKVSSLVRQNIGRMGNWRPDLLTLPFVPLKCICSTISDLRMSEEVFQFRRCILWKDEREKKNKIKKKKY